MGPKPATPGRSRVKARLPACPTSHSSIDPWLAVGAPTTILGMRFSFPPWWPGSAVLSGSIRRWGAVVWLMAAAVPVALAASASPASPPQVDQDISVRVQKAGEEILVDVDCPVRAPVAIVWDVLTDYNNMAGFVSNLQFSGIERRVDNVLTVRQRGKVTRGVFSFAFDNVREIELMPFAEIRSRLVSGDLKASAFTTRIVDLDGLVHISNNGRYTPNVWVPPLIGPAIIEGETRKQFGEIRAEILRRAGRRPGDLASNKHGNDNSTR